MIEAVTKVEDYIQSKKANEVLKKGTANPIDNITLAQLRKQISKFANSPMIARPINTDEARGFSSNSNCLKISQYGTLTPDHILNTKLSPAIFDGSVDDCLSNFSKKIHAYFDELTREW
jgi:rhamnose utilization protein RhaD (predicted bifunctional aldolase and dehydrogenase)